MASFTGQTASWHAAEDICQSRGAHLVSIHDNVVNKFIADNIIQYVYWSGLNSLDKRGVYKWIDSSPYDYSNFVQSTSNETVIDVFERGRCVGIGTNGTWDFYDCNDDFNHYICKISTSKTPSTISPTELIPGSKINIIL